MAAAMAAQQPVSAQIVGNAFVKQYYYILHHLPGIAYLFYQDISQLGRPEDDGFMSITTTMQGINEKILSLNYGDLRSKIKSMDAQESSDGGVHVLVTGYLSGKGNTVRNFSQTFFLAPQENGYFVLNDIFRYMENFTVNLAVVSDVLRPITPEPSPAPLEIHVSQQSSSSTDEAYGGEVQTLHEIVDASIVEEEIAEEEIPVAEVIDEVMHLKESTANFSQPPQAQKASPKITEQVNPPLPPPTDASFSSSDAIDIGNNQDADGYSIYIKGLPMTATESLLEEVFKKFGATKKDGIQVRSNRQQAFCFGFVEFEGVNAAQNAIEASPLAIGGCRAIVEENKSTNSQAAGNTRGRFQSGRGTGFRNEGGADNINGNVSCMSRAGGMASGLQKQ
ncbi:unnamed protein product [Fraxinus pennsylvanica]|uniref:Uncharacterized protein n=1 Tax=Fraxinus pennsylvanica TaxID=56036 RepID=A0AAD1Z1T0_9LAMI|nr:unnamed protein product [Fraxinus pennsylvanica]